MPRATKKGHKGSEVGRPRSAALAARGVQTANEFAGLMSALISDVIEGAVSPGICNAAVNAGGKLLKVVEMQIRYGTAHPHKGRVLSLVGEAPTPVLPAADPLVNRIAQLESQLAAKNKAAKNGTH